MRGFTIVFFLVAMRLAVSLPALAQESVEVEKFALLIGIDSYANLSPGEQLEGSQNDIELIREVLTSRFDFDEQNIIQLLNEQASAKEIRAAFESLVQRIQEMPEGNRAQVYFHFSGHGSQVADQEEGHPDRDEEDGLDETLVPYDAERQGGQGDIRDDEINSLIDRVVGEAGEERANFVLVYDCCHSGSGARGDTKLRKLRRELPQVPRIENVARKTLPPGVVFLSACHETEVEPEFRENGKAFGLLTRFLAQILIEQNEVSEMSYEILHEALRARYQQDSRVVQAPHPQLEASDFDTRRMPVLGATVAIDRPASFRFTSAGKTKHTLQAGQLHGCSPGAILEIYAGPEKLAENESSGFIRIAKSEQFKSDFEFVSLDDATQQYVSVPKPESIQSGVAVLRTPGPADNIIKLKLVVERADGEPDILPLESPLISEPIRTQLTRLANEGDSQRISIVESAAAETDLILKINGQLATLFPSTASRLYADDANSETPQNLRGGWGLFDDQGVDQEGAPLATYIERIMRAKRLIAFASQNQPTQAAFQAEFEIVRVHETDDDGNPTSTSEIKPTENGVVLEVGEEYAVRFRNSSSSKQAAYFTALEVTPDMGIQVVAPYMEKEIRLEPGAEYLCSAFECDVPGTLHEILLATLDPHDFSFIEQQDLVRTRGSADDTAGGLKDQLASTLFPHASKSRGRRKVVKAAKPSWHSQVIQWEVMPSSMAARMRGAPTPPIAATTSAASTVATKSQAADTQVANSQAATKTSVGGASAAPVTKADKSLTTEATDDGYELVTVFYGTDREAVHAGESAAQKAIPLIPLVGLAFTTFLGWFAWRNVNKFRLAGFAAATLLTCVLSLQYVIAMQNRDIALERAGIQYGRGRGELELGHCEVSIPNDHRIGMIESPSILSLEFREDPSRHVTLDAIIPDEEDAFFRNLNEVIEKSPRKEAIVFVHGFNNSFEDAARRTGQMAYDLKYQGAPIFFSWPSQAELAAYTVDENNVTWAVPHLKKFLQDIHQKTNIQSLNLIAHSMGNRAVTNVLKELHLEFKEDAKIFNQVILAAPDVDAEVFKREIAPAITQTAEQVTLYASSKDRALLASKNVHGYPRAGESGENLVVTAGIFTIDVTEIDSSLLGHNYFGDSNSIVSDMYCLLHTGDPPGKRQSLKESTLNSLKYWVFLRTNF